MGACCSGCQYKTNQAGRTEFIHLENALGQKGPKSGLSEEQKKHETFEEHEELVKPEEEKDLEPDDPVELPGDGKEGTAEPADPENQKECPFCEPMKLLDVGEKGTLEYRLRFKDSKDVDISPWHDIPLKTEQEGVFNCIIEIPKMSREKMEVSTKEEGNPIAQDVKKGKLREYHGPIYWNYGMFPQTWEDPNVEHTELKVAGDNDPLDVVEIGSEVLVTGTVARVKVLGALAMIDDGELDWKVICIRTEDPLAQELDSIADVEAKCRGTVSGIREWLRWYKTPDEKPLNTFGFDEKALDKAEALAVVAETHEYWRKLCDGSTEKGHLWVPSSHESVAIDGMLQEFKLCESVQLHEDGEKGTLDYRLRFKDGKGTGISPWHDIPLKTEQEGVFNCVIEIPKMSKKKMEVNTKEERNPIAQDVKKGKPREYHMPIYWNYGMFPQTWEDPTTEHTELKVAGDNDPLDMVEIGSEVLATGTVARVKVLGALAMIDDGELDWKVICVRMEDPLAQELDDIADVEAKCEGTVSGIREWLRWYKMPDEKPLNTFGFEEKALSKAEALAVLTEMHEYWRKLCDGSAERGELWLPSPREPVPQECLGA